MAVMEGGEARTWYSGSHGGAANGLPTATASGAMAGGNGQTSELPGGQMQVNLVFPLFLEIRIHVFPRII